MQDGCSHGTMTTIYACCGEEQFCTATNAHQCRPPAVRQADRLAMLGNVELWQSSEYRTRLSWAVPRPDALANTCIAADEAIRADSARPDISAAQTAAARLQSMPVAAEGLLRQGRLRSDGDGGRDRTPQRGRRREKPVSGRPCTTVHLQRQSSDK